MMLGHAMYLASGRATKKEIDEFYRQMGWSKTFPKKKRRKTRRQTKEK